MQPPELSELFRQHILGTFPRFNAVPTTHENPGSDRDWRASFHRPYGNASAAER